MGRGEREREKSSGNFGWRKKMVEEKVRGDLKGGRCCSSYFLNGMSEMEVRQDMEDEIYGPQ